MSFDSMERLMTFAAMLQQDCGWFDREENAVGFLVSHLSVDAANVQNVWKKLFV